MTNIDNAAANAPLITVLIDTYNYGHFIEEAVESVLAQDFPAEEMEIVVVDDGSTDDTSRRIEKYGSRVRYFFKPNGGQASALNLGIAKARGEIVALLDADDYWLPGKLRRIADEFEKKPEAGMVYHRLLELNANKNERRDGEFRALSGFLPDKPEEFFWYAPHATSCLAFRRKILQQILPIPEGLRLQADGYLGACVVFVAPISAVQESLAVYRIHGRNLYYENEAAMPPERRQARIMARQILIEGVRAWLAGNRYDLNREVARTFFTRWRLYQDVERFILAPPGRREFFLHLLAYNRCYGPYMSRRLRLINHVNAFGTLVVGYKHFYLLDKWRTQLADRLGIGRK